MKKLSKILLMLFCTISVGACNPFKVIDPSDPRFDIEKFSLDDYLYTSEPLREVFKKYLPVGTNKKQVDALLVEKAGATIQELNFKGLGYGLEQYIQNDPEIEKVFFYGWSNGNTGSFPVARHGVYVLYDQSSNVLQMYHLNTFVFDLKESKSSNERKPIVEMNTNNIGKYVE